MMIRGCAAGLSQRRTARSSLVGSDTHPVGGAAVGHVEEDGAARPGNGRAHVVGDHGAVVVGRGHVHGLGSGARIGRASCPPTGCRAGLEGSSSHTMLGPVTGRYGNCTPGLPSTPKKKSNPNEPDGVRPSPSCFCPGGAKPGIPDVSLPGAEHLMPAGCVVLVRGQGGDGLPVPRCAHGDHLRGRSHSDQAGDKRSGAGAGGAVGCGAVVAWVGAALAGTAWRRWSGPWPPPSWARWSRSWWATRRRRDRGRRRGDPMAGAGVVSGAPAGGEGEDQHGDDACHARGGTPPAMVRVRAAPRAPPHRPRRHRSPSVRSAGRVLQYTPDRLRSHAPPGDQRRRRPRRRRRLRPHPRRPS